MKATKLKIHFFYLFATAFFFLGGCTGEQQRLQNGVSNTELHQSEYDSIIVFEKRYYFRKKEEVQPKSFIEKMIPKGILRYVVLGFVLMLVRWVFKRDSISESWFDTAIEFVKSHIL